MSKQKPQRNRVCLFVESLEDRCVPSATDMVLQWNAIALQASVNDYAPGGAGTEAGPTRLSRAMAIVQAAVFDSVNSIDPLYTPYLIQAKAPKDASIDAAVAQAAHDTLVAMFPAQQAFFDSALVSSLQGIPVGPAAEGVAVGSPLPATRWRCGPTTVLRRMPWASRSITFTARNRASGRRARFIPRPFP
jgi:hypothetical protein